MLILPDAANIIILILQLTQLMNLSSGSVPEVEVSSQSHGQVVVVAPVHQVEIVVVENVRSIQDSFRGLGNVSGNLLHRLTLAGAVENLQIVAEI